MSSEWRTTTLGEVTDWRSGGTPKKDTPAYWGGDIPWISANSMYGTRYSDSDLRITHDGLVNGSRLAPKDSILLLVRGGALHNRLPVGIATRDVAFNQDVKALVAKQEVISPWYLLFWLMGQEKYLLNSVVEYTGIGAGKLDTKRMQALEILLPPRSEQDAIVELVKAMDDRINLLRETNATLEAIAQAMFKSWFVDFDPVHAKQQGSAPDGMSEATAALFSDSVEESELGLVPKGWGVSRVEDVAVKVGMGPFGSNIKVSTFVEQGVPVISGQHLRGTLMEDLSFNFVTEAHAEKLKNSCVGAGDVVFTHAGNIGQVSLIHSDSLFDKYVLSQRQFFLRCNKAMMYPEWMIYFFRSPLGQHLLLANSSQVGVPSIAGPVTYLRSIRFVLPPINLLRQFAEIADSLHRQEIANRFRIQTIATLRDTLLPRLVSGQLRIPNEESELLEEYHE